RAPGRKLAAGPIRSPAELSAGARKGVTGSVPRRRGKVRREGIKVELQSLRVSNATGRGAVRHARRPSRQGVFDCLLPCHPPPCCPRGGEGGAAQGGLAGGQTPLHLSALLGGARDALGLAEGL